MLIIRKWRGWILLTCLLRLSLPHVVFEEFGTMAGSVSYMHITLHINLTHVNDLVNEYTAQARSLKDILCKTYSKSIDNSTSEHVQKHLLAQRDVAEGVLDTFIATAEDAYLQIKNLRDILPVDQQMMPIRSQYRQQRDLKRKGIEKAFGTLTTLLGQKGIKIPSSTLGSVKTGLKVTRILKGLSPASMGLSLLKGVFGTFMGLYNAYQMEKLRSDLRGVIQKQNRVIEVLEDHQAILDGLVNDLEDMKKTHRIQDTIRLPVISAQLNRGLSTILAASRQVIHAVQQAHHHRLAVDYYDPETLSYIYETLQAQAKDSKYLLLTRFPSDLFQLELSYLFDGKDVVLFLHVPMVPADSLLTLYRLKPFPIPFSDTMALLPRPQSSLLALSSSIPRSMTHIEHSDLVDCHQVNQVYLCERHGVLNNHIKSSCLGALFEQDIPVAQQICDLELVPYKESVLQLKNNWFLIYSPEMYTAYVQCFNSSSAAVPIQTGVNQIFVDPSCRMTLKNHTLTSDLSMKLDAEVTYFPWKMADLSAFHVTEEDIQAALEIRTSIGERNLFLADVVQHQQFSSRFPKWQWVLAALIFTALVALAIFIALSIGTHRVISFRRRMRRIREALDQIRPAPPPVRPPSRRPSIMADHDHPADQPPMYPGLPTDQDPGEYELMNFTPRRLSREFNHLSKSVSQLTAKYSQSTKQRTSSVPPSRRSSRISFFKCGDADSDDDAEIERLTSRRQTPTPMLRTKTPSYMFLKATANQEQPSNSEA